MRIRIEFDGHGLRLTGVESTAAPPAAGVPPADAPGFVVQACDAHGRVLHAVAVDAPATVPTALVGEPQLLAPAGAFEVALPWPSAARWIVVARRGDDGTRVVARFGLSAPVSYVPG